MAYLTSNTEKIKSKNNSVSEDLSQKNGVSATAVPALQRQAGEEELQMKSMPVQLMEEEEPLQGKFATAQLMEEEEPLQGKFTAQLEAEEEELQMKADPAQLLEEEEPLQGKFATAQLMEEEEPLQGKFTAQLEAEEEELQMKKEPVQLLEEEEPLQGKFDPIQKKKSEPFQLKQISTENIAQLQEKAESPNQTGMPTHLKSGIESLSGYSMSDVKVHYNSDKPKQLQAHAYAQGTDIHIAPGQEKHLPHEAWHVAQQKQGRVQATRQMKAGTPINDDTVLENEADTMGAKALEQGKQIHQSASVQLKEDSNFGEKPGISQRKVVQKAEEDFQAENGPLIGMISNSAIALTSVNWATLAAGTDNVGTATAVGGLVGSLTGVAGSATTAIQGTGKPDVSKAAGDITAGIGSSIGSLVKSVLAIKKAYEAAKGKESVLIGSGDVAIAIMGALKAGAEAAVSIQKFIGGSMPPAVMSMIPGLGIAIAACEAIKNAYTGYNAYSIESEMSGVSGEFKAELVELLGGLPETQAPTLFANEKRGKFGSRITYSRLKPGLFESVAAITERGITPELRNTRMTAFRTAHNLPATLNIEQFAAAIRSYELGSKMQEINQKRKVQGARAVFTSLLSVAGEIAKFFPADGGITAGVLLGASAGIAAAQSAGKFIQGFARDHEILGGDANRSGKSKHKEYVNHTKSIYEFLNTIPQPVMEASKAKVSRAESLLKATGANLATVYKTDYTMPASITNQVEHIVESMKAGR